MPAIGLVDDRGDIRRTAGLHISTALPQGWRCVETAPLPTLNDYPSWLRCEEIVVLVVDERLQEQAGDSEGAAQYNGHHLVQFLRAASPSLPLVVVTAHAEDEDLSAVFGAVEGIIRRDEFYKNAQGYVDRFVRAGGRFLDEHVARLAELSDLAGRIAAGQSTDADRDRARSIQLLLGAQLVDPSLEHEADIVTRIAVSVSDLEAALACLRNAEIDQE